MLRKVLNLLASNGPMTRQELQDALSVKRGVLYKHVLDPAEHLSLIEKTEPGSSPKQKYRITKSGLAVITGSNLPVKKVNCNVLVNQEPTDYFIVDEPLVAPAKYNQKYKFVVPETKQTGEVNNTLIKELMQKIDFLTELFIKSIQQTDQSKNKVHVAMTDKSEDESIVETFAGSEDLLDEEESETSNAICHHTVPGRFTPILRCEFPEHQRSINREWDFNTFPRMLTSLWKQAMGRDIQMPCSIFKAMYCEYGKQIPTHISVWINSKTKSNDWVVTKGKDGSIKSTDTPITLSQADINRFDNILGAVSAYYANDRDAYHDILSVLNGTGVIAVNNNRSPYMMATNSGLFEWRSGILCLTRQGTLLQEFATRVNTIRQKENSKSLNQEESDTTELLSDEERERLYQKVAGIKPSIDKNSFVQAK